MSCHLESLCFCRGAQLLVQRRLAHSININQVLSSPLQEPCPLCSAATKTWTRKRQSAYLRKLPRTPVRRLCTLEELIMMSPTGGSPQRGVLPNQSQVASHDQLRGYATDDMTTMDQIQVRCLPPGEESDIAECCLERAIWTISITGCGRVRKNPLKRARKSKYRCTPRCCVASPFP